ncbi:MAG: hypothetical protein IPL79_10080 [Myxococcales bacterium]|nr:hypothetical protein [Myxococcales bacterium]
MRKPPRLPLLCLVGALAACSSPPANPIWEPANLSADFFALPFPSNARVDAAGHPDLSVFPDAGKVLVRRYLDAIATGVVGFGRNSAIYFRFDGGLDQAALPSPSASMEAAGGVQLINVDPASGGFGQRVPVSLAFRAEAGRYIGDNYLAVMPFPGFPLDEQTTYAVIITTRVAAQPAAFAAQLKDSAPPDDGSGTTAAVYASLAPLRAYLASADAPPVDEIAVATVFTTRSSSDSLAAIAEFIADAAAPAIDALDFAVGNAYFRLYRGSYTAPNFQQGDVPYNVGETGFIEFDEAGLPLVARQESMRVSVTVPTGEMPPAGWPIILYAHGTSGDVESFVTERLALRYAVLGFAMISIDQVLHGPRNPGGDPQIAFFNYFNPYAARDNVLQGSADLLSLRRLVDTIDFVETDADPARPCKFDPSRVFFIGHSQGALTGTPFLAHETRLAGAILSGGGGLFYISATKKIEPLDIPGLIAGALGETVVDEFHPVLALAQTWIDPADPVNYGARLTASSPGRAPYPIFMIEGIGDSYTPNPGAEALATSMSAPQLLPALDTIEGLDLRAVLPQAAPLSNNLDGVTVAVAQYQPAAGQDGHFVYFDNSDAVRQSSSFLTSLLATGTATIAP